MIVSISQQHIDKANNELEYQWRSKSCPIAQFLHEVGYPDARVCAIRCWLQGMFIGKSKLMSQEAIDFIKAYDNQYIITGGQSFELYAENQEA